MYHCIESRRLTIFQRISSIRCVSSCHCRLSSPSTLPHLSNCLSQVKSECNSFRSIVSLIEASFVRVRDDERELESSALLMCIRVFISLQSGRHPFPSYSFSRRHDKPSFLFSKMCFLLWVCHLCVFFPFVLFSFCLYT